MSYMAHTAACDTFKPVDVWRLLGQKLPLPGFEIQEKEPQLGRNQRGSERDPAAHTPLAFSLRSRRQCHALSGTRRPACGHVSAASATKALSKHVSSKVLSQEQRSQADTAGRQLNTS